MPGFDGTGPQGSGPRTGRSLGPCGSGFGRGFGRGFGYRYAEPVTLTKDEQKKILEAEKEQLELELKQLKQKLEELK